MMKYTTPPGWSYNPSAHAERRALVALAALGFAAAWYTGFYQLGVVPHIWDPFFGSHSSYLVTHSMVSRILPFPDGLLGLLGYACDMIFGSIGGEARWRTHPWAVLAFAATITGLGIVSVLLTITMGVLVHSWCTVCLTSASISVIIFGMGIGESLASLQYLERVYFRHGSWHAVWSALWGRGSFADEETPAAPAQARSARRGFPLPVVIVALGIWLMISPDILHFSGAPLTVARVTGPVVVLLGVVSIRDVTRIFQLALFVPSLWLLLAPWFLHYSPGIPLANEQLTGMAIAVLAAIPGSLRQTTGGGWIGLLVLVLAHVFGKRGAPGVRPEQLRGEIEERASV